MIQELKDYFNSIEIPKGPVYLHPAIKINDVRHFLKSHFTALEHNPDSKINAPILERMILLKSILVKRKEQED